MSDLFTFTVEYSEESPHPEKIFSSIAKTIEGMQFLNDELIKCLDLEATNSLTLRSIEKGSIKVVLGTIIKTAENCEFTKEYVEKGSAFLRNATSEVIKLIGHNKRPTSENIKAVVVMLLTDVYCEKRRCLNNVKGWCKANGIHIDHMCKSYAPSHSLVKTKTAKVHKECGKYKQNKNILK